MTVHQCILKTYSTDKGILHCLVYLDENGKFIHKYDILTLDKLISVLAMTHDLLSKKPHLKNAQRIKIIEKSVYLHLREKA